MVCVGHLEILKTSVIEKGMNVNKSKDWIITKKEGFGILVILFFILFITFVNFLVSKRNERDNIRNLDVTNIARSLEKYRVDYGYYPKSDSEGRIIACKGDKTSIQKVKGKAVYKAGAKKPILLNLAACDWGKDSLYDVMDINYPHYLEIIPADPQSNLGVSYRYESDGSGYKIYVSYEGKTTMDYRKSIKEKKILCGKRFCNAGRTIGAKVLE